MKKSIAVLLIVLMLFSLISGALRENVVKANSQPIWAMFHYNPQHTGRCPYDTSNNNGTLKWRYQTGDIVINSSPAIASDGTIYVGSYDNYLYAIGGGGVSPDFSISVAPSSQSVTQGSSTTYAVTITSLNGFNNPVSLSISSTLPSGVTATFSPNQVTPTNSSTLTISTSTSTPANTYTITISASGGGITHTAQITLNVTSITPPSPPQNLFASFSNSSVVLNWTSSQPGTYPIAGYAIYRGTSQGNESPTPIATVGPNTTTYTDKDVISGITYYYYVKAFDNQNPPNYSDPSNEASIKTQEISETTIFFDDFESYEVGTFPSTGGWALIWDGMGSQYQVITNATYHSPSKSFQLWGAYGWSSVAERHFDSTARVIGFEAYMMAEGYPQSDVDGVGSVGFWNREKDTWGKYYVTVEFRSNKYLVVGFINDAGVLDHKEIQPYVPGTWYKVKVILDRSTSTFSVWINDELKVSGIKTQGTYDINALEVSSAWGEVRCYFDDVRVFTVEETPDFSVSASPSSQSVTQGSSTTYAVTITSLNGFNNPVSLSISSTLPSGVTAVFFPNPVFLTLTSSTLIISTSTSTPANSYTITISASGGGITHYTQVILKISQRTYQPDYDGWGFTNYDAGDLTWEMFEQFFGAENVYNNKGQRDPAAEAFYNETYKSGGGLCFGMSGTSIINFLHLDQTNAGSFTLPSIDEPFLVKDSNKVINSVKYYQGTQWGLQFRKLPSVKPVEGYNEIKEKVSQGVPVQVNISCEFEGTIPILGIKEYHSYGHALVAYKVDEVSPDKAYVYVYDPNHPGDTSRKIEFNLSEDRWDYQFSENDNWFLVMMGWQAPSHWYGDADNPNMVVIRDPSILTEKGIPPWIAYNVAVTKGDFANPLLTDTQGNHYGYVNNQFVNNIPGLIEVSPIVGDTSNKFSQIVFVPNSTNLASVSLYGTGEGTGNFSLINKNSTFELVNVPVTSNTIDRIDILQDGTSLTYTTNDVNKEYEVRLIRGFDNKSIIADINTSISQSDIVTLKLDSKNEFVYKNIGGTKTYSLTLEQVGQNSGSFSCTNLVIRNNETHIIKVGNWDNLDTTNVVLEIDKNSDGTIDEIKALRLNIVSSAGFGGVITPSGTITVNYGGSQSFTIKADAGYFIYKILVDNAPIQFNNPMVYTYTFNNVTANHTISAEFMKIPDTTPPSLTLPTINGVNLDVPGAVITTNSGTFTFTVSAYDESGIGRMVVKVNGVVQIDKNNLDPTIYLCEGVNTVEVTVYDTAGNYTTKSFKVISDTKPPVIDVTLPETVSSPEITVKGVVVDLVTGVQSVTVNGNPVIPTLEGNFETKLTLSPGTNTITIEATDNVGNKSTKSFTISYIQPQAKQSYIVILKVGDPNITVNGISQKIDAQGSKPIIKNGRTLLPIRTLIESIGGTVEWDAKEQKVTIILNGHSMVLWIGKTTALVDGSNTALDVAPTIITGRTYLPLRFISEHLGGSVDWDSTTQTITIYYWP